MLSNASSFYGSVYLFIKQSTGKFLVLFLLISLSTYSFANTQQSVKETQAHSAFEDWKCKCSHQAICQTEVINQQLVFTIPPSCLIETPYIPEQDHPAAAIRLVLDSVEPPNKYFVFIHSDFIHDFPRKRWAGIKIEKPEDLYRTTTGYANIDTAKNYMLTIQNIRAKPLHLVDYQIISSSTKRIGAILYAEGGGLQANYTSDPYFNNQAWIPLPLDYENQVPLAVEFHIKPENIVQSIQYQVDDLGNWGALIHLQPGIASDSKIDFAWEEWVLTDDSMMSSNRNYYSTPKDPHEWLSSSAIVQSSDPQVVATANSLANGKDSSSLMKEIVEWLVANIQPEMNFEGLDALSVLQELKGTCTGYANLAAALGRTLNIPTMTLAGYATGIVQQTHWINQFYLGDKLGWRRVEPQGVLDIESEYFISVRIDRVSEEILWYFHKGIPKLSMPEVPVYFIGDDGSPRYIEVEGYNHIEFTDSAADMDRIFMKARKAWQKDFKALIQKGSLDPQTQSLRHQFRSATSLQQVEAILDQLNP